MNSSPPLRSYRDIPVYSWSEWDTVGLVKQAIRNLEGGVFDQAALVGDAMTRDDRIGGVLEMRSNALSALPMTFEAKEKDGKPDKEVVKDLETTWHTIFPRGSTADLLSWAIRLGVGVGELIWTRTETKWTPSLKVWHPRYLSWHWLDRALYMSTQDGLIKIAPGDGKWVVLAPWGLDYAWMKGKLRSLYVPWLIRQWGMRDWARASEVYGQPIRKAITPMGATDEDKDAFFRAVANIGNETILRTPRVAGIDQDNSKYDLELVEATADFSTSFEKLNGMASVSIAVNILGQNLTTEVQGGSLAATDVHKSIRNDVLKGDGNAVSECYYEQILKPYVRFNFGDEERTPKPCWKTDPPEDKAAKGTALQNIGLGITALQATGAKPNVDKILEDAEIPVTEPAGEPPTQAAPEPDGDEENTPANAPAPGEKSKRAPGKGQKPGAQDKANARKKASAKKVAKASAAPALLSAEGDPRARKFIEGQAYADDIADDGRTEARDDIKPDLADLVRIIQNATSYAEIRAELLRAYPKMKTETLAEVVRRSLLLAELNGMHAVLEET